jgi:hypothetical protein
VSFWLVGPTSLQRQILKSFDERDFLKYEEERKYPLYVDHTRIKWKGAEVLKPCHDSDVSLGALSMYLLGVLHFYRKIKWRFGRDKV